MTLDQFLSLMALVGVIVCGVPLYIDSLGGWAMWRSELRAERRRKKRAARVGYSRRGRFVREVR